MKKESVLLVILVFAFVVVNPSLISIGKMKERAKVGVVFKALDSKWWKTMEGGVYNEVSKYPNIEVVVLAPQAEINVAQQVEIIESLIIQKVDALVIAPCGSEELIPTFEKAKKANIPVIIVDTDTPWKGKECFIGVNNTKGGILGAQYITNRLNGAGKVAIITGIMGHTTHMDRLKGAKAVFEAEEGMEIVAVQPANSDRYQGMQVMENILTANPDLNGVFCLNDQMALGALEAIKAAEKLEEITIIGFDGTPEACQSIKKGEMDATVGERPSEFGSSAVKYAVKILNHENIPKNIELTLKMVTEENADEWIKCW